MTYALPLLRANFAFLAVSATLTAAVLSPAAAAPATNAARPDDPPGLAGALLAARHAGASADTVTAQEYYDRALQLDPNNSSLLWRSYSAAATAGKIEAAIASAKRYYDSEERPLPLAGLLLATGHAQKKEYDKAWAYIERIPADSYLGFALPMVRAWIQAARNTPDAALAELSALQKTQGLGDIYHMMAGLLNEHIGRNADALIHYDALAEHIERQPLSVVRLITDGYHRLGHSTKVAGLVESFKTGRGGGIGIARLADGLKDSARVRKKVGVNDGLAETYFAISQLLSQQGMNTSLGDVAIALGQMAIYLNPDLTIGRWVLGSTLAAKQRFDDSNAALSVIKKTEPAYLGAQFQITDNLIALGQRGDALARLQALARDYPDMADIPMAIGNLLRRDEKFAEAVLAYDKAIELQSQSPDQSWALYYGRGVALERTQQWKRAESDFMRALELNPDQPDVLNYLGYSWIDRGENFSEARRLIELAYSKSPDNGYIVDSLGWAMYLSGDYKGAVTYLEKAVELQPADPTLNDHLGDAYWKVGRRNEARFQWQRALTLKPEDKQKKSLQAKLEQGLAQK